MMKSRNTAKHRAAAVFSFYQLLALGVDGLTTQSLNCRTQSFYPVSFATSKGFCLPKERNIPRPLPYPIILQASAASPSSEFSLLEEDAGPNPLDFVSRNDDHVDAAPRRSRPSAAEAVDVDRIPTTLREALRIFLFGPKRGPLVVIVCTISAALWRLCPALNENIGINLVDMALFSAAIIFWWFQEHAMHLHLLHSKFDWIGKAIHEAHHAKPYHHISIDPPGLMIGWLLAVHISLRLFLPLPLAVSATLGYSCAGLFYEWAHYIAHTKVRFAPNSYWQRMKDHHIRHHLVDSNSWLGFSLPAVDDLFGTNPTVQQVRQNQRGAKKSIPSSS